MNDSKIRCDWSTHDPLYISYHDREWGVPLHNDQLLFEFLLLEGAQAGLSWITILKKRENYRLAFDNFDYHKIACYTEVDVERLMGNKGIVRNRLKINAFITNAKMTLKVIEEFGSLDAYLWSFVEGETIQHHFTSMKDVPPKNEASERMSMALKQSGFKFVGPTICYAFMQATGMVNDHITSCFRYEELRK